MQTIAGVGQVWRFAKEIAKGDLVALPLRTEASVQFGRVKGEYQYKKLAPNVMHIRSVEWIKKLPRSAFKEDLLYSLNSLLTVFQVKRNDAEARIKQLLDGRDPQESAGHSQLVEENAEDVLNLETSARDELIKFIQENYKGHRLTDLVAGVLRAQGYKTKVSPAGPDGGVDILAGSGSLGLDEPRLCVQVKSGGGTEGQATLNELRGVVSHFSSQQGLLVSWGGFTKPVLTDARKDYFKIRLWDQGDLVDAILHDYERLDADIKAELPMKRIWVMVRDEEE